MCRIQLIQNWEAVPSKPTEDWVTTSYNPYPSKLDPREVYDYIIDNNLIITKEENEIGLNNFIHHVTGVKPDTI